MKLFFRKLGQGKPLIILHGLFGMSDNWQTLGKRFAEYFEVYLVDMRNHGLSPHSDDWNYQYMSDDILELINDNNISKAFVLGHSMGGKAAMKLAMQHADRIEKLIVVDIAPKAYPVHHDVILDALNTIDFNVVKSRKEAEDMLSKLIDDVGTKQFLLKNIYWVEEEKLAWRFNLDTIEKNISIVGEENIGECVCATLFIRGSRSNYINDNDLEDIHEKFPLAIVETIENAGHWVHAEAPQEFYNTVMRFLGEGL